MLQPWIVGEVHHGAAIEPDRRAVEADGAASEPQDRAAEQAACRPGPSSPEEDEPQSAAKASVIPADAAADTKECVPSELETPKPLEKWLESKQYDRIAKRPKRSCIIVVHRG